MSKESTYVSYDNIDFDFVFKDPDPDRKNDAEGTPSPPVIVITQAPSLPQEDHNPPQIRREEGASCSISHQFESDVTASSSVPRPISSRPASFPESLPTGASPTDSRQTHVPLTWSPKTRKLKDKKKRRKLIQNDDTSLMTSSANPRSTTSQLKVTAHEFDDKTYDKRKAFTLPRKFSLDKIRSAASNTLQRKTKDKEAARTPSSDSGMTTRSSLNPLLIVKVFVDALQVGVNYKTVMITETTTARDLLTLTLQRCGVKGEGYTLCEVIRNNADDSSHATKKATKPEEFVRTINTGEFPLTIQSRWCAEENDMRRFEVRKPVEINKRKLEEHLQNRTSKSEFDSIQYSLQSVDPCEDDCEKITSFEDVDPLCEVTSKFNIIEITNSSRLPFNPSSSQKKPDSWRSLQSDVFLPPTHDPLMEERPKPEGHSDSSANQDPNPDPPHPYFLTLQGDEDVLVRTLEKTQTFIGSDVTDFKLVAPDVQRNHCVIKRELEFENSDVGKRWCVTIAPLHKSAEVRINGSKINSPHVLDHGQMVSVGKQHLFMFKDPLSQSIAMQGKPSMTQHLTGSVTSSNNSSAQVDMSKTHPPPTSSPAPANTVIKTALNYSLKDESRVFQIIFEAFQTWGTFPSKYVIAPATLLSHCIFQSYLNFPTKNTCSTFEKLIENLSQTIEGAVQQVEDSIVSRGRLDPVSFHPVMDLLDPVIFWLTNAQELLNFFDHHLPKAIRKRLKKERKRGLLSTHRLDEIEQFRVQPNWSSSLHDVVTTAFQCVLYNVTKILYELLPAIFYCNPFDISDRKSNDVTFIVTMLTVMKSKLQEYQLDSQTTHTLFSYLFFFTNSFLFNALMDEGSAEKYFKWETGVRIKGNFERLRLWAFECGLSSQCEDRFKTVTALANLLATPFEQLEKLSFSNIQTNFSPLSHSQLTRILSSYQLPKNKSRPLGWKPSKSDPGWNRTSDNIFEGNEVLPVFSVRDFPTNIDLHSPPTDPISERLCLLITKQEPLEFQGGNAPPHSFYNSTNREKPDGHESLHQESLNHAPMLRDVIKGDDVIQAKAFRPIPDSDTISSASEARGNGFHRHCLHSEAGKKTKKIKVKLDEARHEKRASPWSKNSSKIMPRGNKKKRSGSGDRLKDSQKDIIFVQLKKDSQGLGVGLVDGLVTSLNDAGVFVRFIVPDLSSGMETSIQHHDVLRCWPKEGRLQLGDRILAVNGISLIDMTYRKAMHTLDQVEDDVRLVVGRGSHLVATKVLLPQKRL